MDDDVLDLSPDEEGRIEEKVDELLRWISSNQEFAETLGSEYSDEEKQTEALRVALILTFLAGYLYAKAEDRKIGVAAPGLANIDFRLSGPRRELEQFFENMFFPGE